MREYIILKYSLKSFIIFISGNFYYDLFSLLFIKIRTQQTFVLMRTSFVFVFRRRLQYVLIKANIFVLVIRLQRTSLRLFQDVLISASIFAPVIRLQEVLPRCLPNVFKTSSRLLKNVLKTSSRHFQDILPRRLQDVFKASSKRLTKTHLHRIFKHFQYSSRHLPDVLPRRLQDIFKASSKRFAKTSSSHLQDIFNTPQDILKTSCKDIFKTYHLPGVLSS